MLDQDIANLLGQVVDSDPRLLPEMVPAMRDGMRQIGATLPAPIVRIDAHRAGEVPLRLYRPNEFAPEGAPLLIFLHGGGWLLGDLDSHDAICRNLAVRIGCPVLGVAYRLAPEHPFPAGLDDCLEAFRWARDNAASLGCDADRIALGGESAGANLAAVATVKLRDRGEALPAFQVLIHPATDLTLAQPSIDSVPLAGMSRSYLEACVGMYAGEHDPADPGMSPLRCADLSRLPPALVYTVEVDPLRDDGEQYALALAQAGGEVLLRRLAGLPHGFMFLPTSIGAVDRAYDLLARRIATYFEQG